MKWTHVNILRDKNEKDLNYPKIKTISVHIIEIYDVFDSIASGGIPHIFISIITNFVTKCIHIPKLRCITQERH